MKNHEKYEEISNKLKVMGHPERLRILHLLIEKGAQNGKQINGMLKMPQSTVSQHLTKLKMQKLIYGRREGTEVYYDIKDNLVWKIMIIPNKLNPKFKLS
ncbi:TPA: ArsR/SmtB family transcription factor [Bacillus cereus]|nr:helix-turn-helix transcriptional regulator [Bacillus cereus]MBL3769889.1 helix-turn-helix transcriptional regulator [Bacillus cereus]MBL3776017.1 helix-turn-helix transcriptional regulator [Bacillus cereus]MBL3787304.1 helix-turn-helix transcriptional regulator [Bacillus cereus]HDR4614687.1 helix-turn-helix transcriptional regulator [Bacillus cereus]